MFDLIHCEGEVQRQLLRLKMQLMPSLQRSNHSTAVMQAILTEVARVRAYGFSERELKHTHDYLLADYESLYVERDQVYAQVWGLRNALISKLSPE